MSRNVFDSKDLLNSYVPQRAPRVTPFTSDQEEYLLKVLDTPLIGVNSTKSEFVENEVKRSIKAVIFGGRKR